MGSGVLVSHGVGPHYPDMLRLAAVRDVKFAQKWGMGYVVSQQREADPEDHVYWDKVALLNRVAATRPNGDLILWKDPDTMFACMDYSPYEVLPRGKDIAIMRVKLKKTQEDWYNAGVVFIRLSADSRKFLTEWYSRRKIQRAFHTDEWPLLDLEKKYKIHDLPRKWNCMKRDETPIIRAFHLWDKKRAVEKLQDTLCTSVCKIRKEG